MMGYKKEITRLQIGKVGTIIPDKIIMDDLTEADYHKAFTNKDMRTGQAGVGRPWTVVTVYRGSMTMEKISKETSESLVDVEHENEAMTLCPWCHHLAKDHGLMGCKICDCNGVLAGDEQKYSQLLKEVEGLIQCADMEQLKKVKTMLVAEWLYKGIT